MEEIDLKELFIYIKNKIGLLIIITFGITLIGSLYGLLIQKPMFNSYTTVVLGGTESSNTGITQNDININKNLVDTYAEIVKSRSVLDKVIDELKLDMTYNQLGKIISVSALNDTEIIKITVDNEDAILAKNIANSTAKFFIVEVKALYNMDNVNVLDEAIVSDSPYNVNVLKQTLIYVLIGLVVAFGVVFIVFYFDRTIKTVEQVEQKIKLPILGTVQKSGKGGSKK